MKSKSKYLKHGPCPECDSKDNLAWFDDGHAHCYGCGYQYQPTQKEKRPMPVTPIKKPDLIDQCRIISKAMTKRGITKETTELYGYGSTERHGQQVQVATYRDQLGKPCAQHLRTKDKRFSWIGDCSDMQLWGQHLWRQVNQGGTFVVITEGEVDCMSVSQAQGNKYPVVSLPNGAQSASKYIAANLKWLSGFNRIVLCLDSDEPGMAAAEKAVEVLPAGSAAICRLPRKDANEMLVAGEGELLRDLLWKSTPVRPDGIVNAADLWDELIKPGSEAICKYPWPQLDKVTRGFRKGEMISICAGSGTGKSSICKELAHYFLINGLKVGFIALEESIQRTLQGIIGIELSLPLHLDLNLASQETIRSAFDRLCATERLFLYDHFGSMDPDRLVEQIQYLANVEGVDVVFVDHLTIVVSGISDCDERRALDVTCTKLRQTVESTGVGLFIVSHLKRPEGRGHEEGSQVSLSHLRGSHSIAQLSDICIAAERNQQGDVAERSELQLRCLKNRFAGTTGPVDLLHYDQETGRLSVPMSSYF